MWCELYTLNSLCKRLRTLIQRCPLSFWELVLAFCTQAMTVWRKGRWWDKKEQNKHEEWLWSLSELASSDPWDFPVLTLLRKAAESQAWRSKLKFPTLMRLRQEDCEFEASLSCLANPCFRKKKLKKKRGKIFNYNFFFSCQKLFCLFVSVTSNCTQCYLVKWVRKTYW